MSHSISIFSSSLEKTETKQKSQFHLGWQCPATTWHFPTLTSWSGHVTNYRLKRISQKMMWKLFKESWHSGGELLFCCLECRWWELQPSSHFGDWRLHAKMVEDKDRICLGSLMNLWGSYTCPRLPTRKKHDLQSPICCLYCQSFSLAVNKTPDIVYLL